MFILEFMKARYFHLLQKMHLSLFIPFGVLSYFNVKSKMIFLSALSVSKVVSSAKKIQFLSPGSTRAINTVWFRLHWTEQNQAILLHEFNQYHIIQLTAAENTRPILSRCHANFTATLKVLYKIGAKVVIRVCFSPHCVSAPKKILRYFEAV